MSFYMIKTKNKLKRPDKLENVYNSLLFCTDTCHVDDLDIWADDSPTNCVATQRKKQCHTSRPPARHKDGSSADISQASIHLATNKPRSTRGENSSLDIPNSVDVDSSSALASSSRRKSGTFVSHLIYKTMNLFGYRESEQPINLAASPVDCDNSVNCLNTAEGNRLMSQDSVRSLPINATEDSQLMTDDEGLSPRQRNGNDPSPLPKDVEDESYSNLVVIDSLTQQQEQPTSSLTSRCADTRSAASSRVTRSLRRRPQSTQQQQQPMEANEESHTVPRSLRRRQKNTEIDTVMDYHKKKKKELLQEAQKPLKELSKFKMELSQRTYLLDYILRLS